MHKTIHFTKMHGLGNDFVVINNLDAPINVDALHIKHLADRHAGIGFDQLLIIEKSKLADFFCRIFNADGSEAEQCGNGLRCVARFIHENHLTSNASFTLATKAGLYPVTIKDYDHITVQMGEPTVQEGLMELTIGEEVRPVTILSVGNPHTILRVSDDEVNFHALGKAISRHPYFPKGTNVGFMQVLDASHIKLRTYERGTGETLACGSNACAAAVAGMINGWLEPTVNIAFARGSLTVSWAGGNAPIIMSGGATSVFRGELSL